MIVLYQSQHEQWLQLHARFPRNYFQAECDLYELLVNLHKKRKHVAEAATAALTK